MKHKNASYYSILRKYKAEAPCASLLEELCDSSSYGEDACWKEFGFIYAGIIFLYYEEWLSTHNGSFINALRHEASVAFKDALDSPCIRRILAYIFQDEDADNLLRDIHDGASEFKKAFLQKCGDKKADANSACLPLVYMATALNKYDEMLLWNMRYATAGNGKAIALPLAKHDKITVGIVSPWAGDLSAEFELLIRMRKALEDNGMACIFFEGFGQQLDAVSQKKIGKRVDASELDFVISVHYEMHKSVDSFYYHAVWNPPEIPLRLKDYAGRITDNYLMNDDYLVYDAGGMKNHLQTMLLNSPRNLDDASCLIGSFPESAMMEPRLENPVMFYCGMNWEVLFGGSRHAGLFKLLDDTGKVKFFGPDKVDTWGGLRPWAGYKCYQYSIPFDGFSILKEINACGICLVLSSDIHRRAGAVTNRAYEAIAAGAVIISDDNEFMERHFKDAALFITYDKKNPQDTFAQIMEKYEWILANKEAALEMARKAQRIFRERFSLDKQFMQIVQRHSLRFNSVKEFLFAKNEEKLVLVTYVADSQDEETVYKNLTPVIANIKNQYYRNIILCVAADATVAVAAKQWCDAELPGTIVCPFPLFDKKGSRQLTCGYVIREMQKVVSHDYFLNTNTCEQWFYDHVTTLVRAVEDADCLGAYSGKLHVCPDRHVRPHHFGVYTAFDFVNFALGYEFESPGMFLFKSAAHELIPDFVFSNVDCLEHFLYANIIVNKAHEKLAFSRRMTFSRDDDVSSAPFAVVIPYEMQIRLIQDLVRFDCEEYCAFEKNRSVNYVTKDYLQSVMLRLPVASYVKIRYYKRKLAKVKPGSIQAKKLTEKYHRLMQKKYVGWAWE